MDEAKPKLKLVEALEQSIFMEDQLVLPNSEQEVNNVVDFTLERMGRKALAPKEISPRDVLRFAQLDCERFGDVTKCYVTLVRETANDLTVLNYRAGMNKIEELAFRQLGVQETIDGWRFGDGEMPPDDGKDI